MIDCALEMRVRRRPSSHQGEEIRVRRPIRPRARADLHVATPVGRTREVPPDSGLIEFMNIVHFLLQQLVIAYLTATPVRTQTSSILSICPI